MFAFLCPPPILAICLLHLSINQLCFFFFFLFFFLVFFSKTRGHNPCTCRNQARWWDQRLTCPPPWHYPYAPSSLPLNRPITNFGIIFPLFCYIYVASYRRRRRFFFWRGRVNFELENRERSNLETHNFSLTLEFPRLLQDNDTKKSFRILLHSHSSFSPIPCHQLTSLQTKTRKEQKKTLT